MVQPTPEVLQSHGLKKPEEYTKQELGKLMLKVHMECGVTILVNVPYADRHHKYPTIMPKVLRFTTTSGAGTCTSTRARSRCKSYYCGHFCRVLVVSVSIRDVY
jgi:hypothetical protein